MSTGALAPRLELLDEFVELLSEIDAAQPTQFYDRGGGHFRLTGEERHVMWTLGKLAALASSARIATRQQELTRSLADQIALAREIHERVMQRLFAVSLVLHSDSALSRDDRDRARQEIRDAVADLRTMLERPLARRPRPTSTTLRAEL